MVSVHMNIWKQPPFLATRHSCGSCHADAWLFVEHRKFQTGGIPTSFKAIAWRVVPSYEIAPLYSMKNLSIRFKNDTNLKQNDTN